jgi:hypothetical protein
MLRILGQLASTVALLFAAAALIGTTYLAGYLGGFGVSLTTVRLDPGTAVLTALVPTVYLLPAMLVAFGYVFSVAVGLAAADEATGAEDRPRPRTFRQRWFDEALLEGVGFALIAAVISVGILAGTLILLNLPRSPDVIVVNVIVPALAAVLGIFPARWIATSSRFAPTTRVWWSMLGIIVWAILIAIVTYILGAEVARQYTDQLASASPGATRVTIRDALPGLTPSGPASPLGAVSYDSVVLLFRDEQAWLFAVRDTTAPRGYRAILVPAIQVIGVTSVD